MSLSRPPSSRPSRIDDALSQLVDSILPPLSLSDLGDKFFEDEDALVVAEERRHRDILERSWRILENYAEGENRPTGSITEDINNASDLIKRKLLRENASPDKAVRFSNLYSRLLTQPVLSQKWAILYLLYQLSETSLEDNGVIEEGERSRSPLMQEVNLDNMLFKGVNNRQGMRMGDDLDEGPAISSSVSQRGSQPDRIPQPRKALEGERGHSVTGEESGDARPTSSVRQEQNPPSPAEANGGNTKMVQPPESVLLRDLPFILQGLSSTNLEFSAQSTLKLPTTLPVSMISLLYTLAEPCLLYRELVAFVECSEGGLVSQALRAAIGNELRSYLSLIATLEGEIRRAATAANTGTKDAVKGAVTLKRCVVWTREATMALRLMSSMIHQAQNKKGGQLISIIHCFSLSHGDPFICAYAEKLLTYITRPFYDMLRQWIYDGELSDPYNEFFVVEPEFRPNTDPRRIATSVWEDKYKLDDDMVPTIITPEFAKKVFLIGKSLNFIRYGCGDSAWVEAYSKDASKELRYGDTASLETSIDEAYKTTMARMIRLMDSKFKLFDHLKALKKYLLLGQGDFIALLMESLASNLDRPANSQYRHTLTAQLEHAIRASNAQYDSPDVLRRLDARMLELSHGEIGWDCFTLEYKIDAPVDVVITPRGSTEYLKVFNFLWRVKRVEFALSSTWRRCMTGARGVLGSVDDKVGSDWKRAHCVIAEMIHFVCQLQYYILFEVIEASWDQLQAAISRPGCTLDDLIEAHTRYLNSITHKGLLGSASSSRGSTSTASSKQPEESFLSQLHHILKIMLAYRDVVDGLYSFSVAEFTRRQELSAKIETRTAQGHWGVTERDFLPTSRHGQKSISTPSLSLGATPIARQAEHTGEGADTPLPLDLVQDLSADDHMLPSLRARLSDLSADFRSRLNVLLGDLAHQPDVDMRFLAVVMNFNDVYKPVRRRRTGTTSGSSARDKERVRRKAATVAAATVTSNNDESGAQSEEKERTSFREVGNGGPETTTGI